MNFYVNQLLTKFYFLFYFFLIRMKLVVGGCFKCCIHMCLQVFISGPSCVYHVVCSKSLWQETWRNVPWLEVATPSTKAGSNSSDFACLWGNMLLLPVEPLDWCHPLGSLFFQMPDGLDHTLPLLLSCHSNAAFVCVYRRAGPSDFHIVWLSFSSLPFPLYCFLWAFPDLARRQLWVNTNTYFFEMITENFKHRP